MKNWCMTCRHPGKLLEQALQQWEHRYRRKPGYTDTDPKMLYACQDTPRAAGDLFMETVLSTVEWRERVAPPELMVEPSRTVLTSKQSSQILEQIGTGAEARATSGNSAICETCG